MSALNKEGHLMVEGQFPELFKILPIDSYQASIQWS